MLDEGINLIANASLAIAIGIFSWVQLIHESWFFTGSACRVIVVVITIVVIASSSGASAGAGS